MGVHWGVDSYNPANHTIHVPRPLRGDGEERQALYDFVSRRIQAPEFWGRYLNPYEYGLTGAEREFLAGHGCKLLLVYNGPRDPLTGPNSGRAGRTAAEQACRLARALNVPRGVRIYADLEGWVVDPDWLRGWCEYMYESEYAGMGGLYGRGAEISRAGGTPYHPRRVWATSVSTAMEQMAGHGFDETLDSISDGHTVNKQGLTYVWSNMPRGMGDPPANRETIPHDFGAVGPASPLIDTVVWQYRLNCELGTPHPLVDMDLATDRGFDEMWV